jgi:hypothetical protein
LYTFLTALMHATCPAQPTLADLITLIICGEAYRLWSHVMWVPVTIAWDVFGLCVEDIASECGR